MPSLHLSGKYKMTTQVLPEAVVRFNTVIKEAEVLLSIARATELQQAACNVLEDQATDLAQQKAIAVSNAAENLANLLLGCECVNTCILAELRMWILLKQEQPDEAWDQLILAQDCALAAARAHAGFGHLSMQNEKLEAIERLVFPPQVFISSGLVNGSQECSICGSEYGECEHLVGRPYMGRFCHIIARQLSADHVALVKEPADKRCRVRSFSVEGGYRSRMTWRVASAAAHDA